MARTADPARLLHAVRTVAAGEIAAAPWLSAIIGTGLKNLPAEYHASNYYPPAENRDDMRYGAFVQLWSTRHGDGRVLAFTDSTIFAGFSLFEPGKTELFLGMLEWLNRRAGQCGLRRHSR